jgi:hypothetical protein
MTLLLSIWYSSRVKLPNILYLPTTPQKQAHDVGTFQVGTFNITNDQLPIPVKVLKRYIHQHGVRALRRNAQNRQFAVAYYRCPRRAGNWLHQFFNGMLWSIVTNRTLLWKYYDTEAFLKYNRHINPERTHYPDMEQANSEKDCRRAMVRANWLPSYDEWGHLFDEEPFYVPYHATVFGKEDDDRVIRRPANYKNNFGIDDASKYPHQILVWPLDYDQIDGMNTSLMNTFLHTKEARTISKQLFRLGINFMYGMFHRYTFDVSEEVHRAVPSKHDLADHYTIALHSRHRFAAIDGCNVTQEIGCIQEILRRKTDDRPVRVSIMSDRPCTITSLTEWLTEQNMNVIVAPHPDAKKSFRHEHGPFAGIGYYYDMAVVSGTVRDAVVITLRSSSFLVHELIVFDRIMEQYQRGGKLEWPKVCILKRKYPPDLFNTTTTNE